MKEPIDRSPPYVSDLLEAERAAPSPGREVQNRVRARVAATLIAATTTGAATTAAAAKGASAGLLASLAAKATLIVVVVASAGATGGIALRRRQVRTRSLALLATPAPNASARTARPSLSPAAVASSMVPVPIAVAPVAAPAVAPAPFATPPAVERRHARAEPPPSSHDRMPGMNVAGTAEELTDENVLIEAARTALGTHDPRSAVGLLERHARLHPSGQMEEEREALWVQALAVEGDGTAARERAAAFRRRFPRSIQLEVVSAALDTIP
jgi:hypothetical protein